MKKLLTRSVVGGIASVLSCSAVAAMAPPGALVVQNQEPQFTVQLPANATTGYQWYLESYDPHVLKLLGYRYHVSNPKLMGSPGTAVFIFEGQPSFFVAPQQTTLEFVYAQPWELKNGQTKEVTVVSIAEATPAVQVGSAGVEDSGGNMMVPVKS